MSEDVLVVGGGIEGHVAALTAAEEGAGSVRLLVPDGERFRHETGLIDLLGYTPEGDGPMGDPFETLSTLPPEHPYSRVGVEGVRTALSLFEDATGYVGGTTESNALVGTCNGNVKPTARYPESVAPGLVSKDREMLLVGFPEIVDFDVDLAAAKLDGKLPYDVGSTTIRLDVDSEEHQPALALARALNDDTETEDGLPARRAVAGKIRNSLDIEPRIGFPAVLGRDDSEAVRSDLESILQADVFELPLGPPSLPGMRLGSRLRSALDDAGVAVETGVTVTGVESSDGRIETLSATAEGPTAANGGSDATQFEAAQYVLATGGLAAGGLDSDRASITEPIFDCDVPHPGDREDWVTAEFLGDQPFARFGLDVDDEFRPLSADGSHSFENLRAAGPVLGGADFAAEQSTGGVAVATGYRAGELAADGSDS